MTAPGQCIDNGSIAVDDSGAIWSVLNIAYEGEVDVIEVVLTNQKQTI